MVEDSMGRVTVRATVESLADLYEADRGARSPAAVRSVTIEDALVDTAATTLALPTPMIRQLGLRRFCDKQVKSTQGIGSVTVYEAVRLTIHDRFCTADVMEVPDDVPALIGQIPLEMLDLVVDLQARKHIGNPAHNGEPILELF